MELLTDYDHVAVFDADFKPDTEFLVDLHPHCCLTFFTFNKQLSSKLTAFAVAAQPCAVLD